MTLTKVRGDSYESGYYHYMDEELELKKILELANALRSNLLDREIEKVRIDIELAADCGCMPNYEPAKENDNDQTQKET